MSWSVCLCPVSVCHSCLPVSCLTLRLSSWLLSYCFSVSVCLCLSVCLSCLTVLLRCPLVLPVSCLTVCLSIWLLSCLIVSLCSVCLSRLTVCLSVLLSFVFSYCVFLCPVLSVAFLTVFLFVRVLAYYLSVLHVWDLFYPSS